MANRKKLLLIVISTICLVAMSMIPCYASEIVPEDDIVDDMQQGIVVYSRYIMSFNGSTGTPIAQSGSFFTPFEWQSSKSQALLQENVTLSLTTTTNNTPMNDNAERYTSEQWNQLRVPKNSGFDYALAISVYSNFYMNVEYDYMMWKAVNTTQEEYSPPSINIRYSICGSTEARQISLNNVREVDISQTIKNDILEINPETENFNVFIWGLETRVYSNYLTNAGTDELHRIIQQLITDIDVLKIQKNNSRNTDLRGYADFVMSEYNKSFDNISRDWTSWIGEAVGGFMSFEIAPYISIGGIFAILIAIALTSLFIKLFMGG